MKKMHKKSNDEDGKNNIKKREKQSELSQNGCLFLHAFVFHGIIGFKINYDINEFEPIITPIFSA